MLDSAAMGRKVAYTFLIDPELVDGLKRLRARDGAPASETIRRAVTEYLERKGIDLTQKADRPRVPARKRS